eukprot:Tbor_TRINITY_DN6086_c0_g1::TRINITY_DN6086_c0_g1_i1::g.10254::m.10254
MDQAHQDHLNRILENRRKRGISPSRFASAADKGRAFYIEDNEPATSKVIQQTTTKGCQFNSADSLRLNYGQRAGSPDIAAPLPSAVRPDRDYQSLERKLQLQQQNLELLKARQDYHEQEHVRQVMFDKHLQSYHTSASPLQSNSTADTSSIRQIVNPNREVTQDPQVGQRQLFYNQSMEKNKLDSPNAQRTLSPLKAVSVPIRRDCPSLVPPSARRGLLGRSGGTEVKLGGISAIRAKGGKSVSSSIPYNLGKIKQYNNLSSSATPAIIPPGPTLTDILNENQHSLTGLIGSPTPNRDNDIVPRPVIPYKYGILPPPIIQHKVLPYDVKPKQSIMDPRSAISILRNGDWFFKWNENWTQAEARYIWLDINRYILQWGRERLQSSLFGGSIALELLTHVTTDQIQEFDGDVSRIFFILRLHSVDRNVYLATEKREKLDCWFEAVNSVIMYYKSLSVGGIKGLPSD